MVTSIRRSPDAREALPLPQQLEQRDPERLRAYRENLDFYRGAQWKEPQRRRERRLTFNYAKTIIEKTAAYVIGGMNSVVDPANSDTQEDARRAEQALRELSDANNLEQLDFDNEVDCSILGDAACKLVWDAGEKRVCVSAPDVQGLFVWWVGDDVSKVWRVASRYLLTVEEAQMLYPEFRPAERRRLAQASRRREHTLVEVWTDSEFQVWLDNELLEERRNPYGFIPFVVYPNLREPKQFWGLSDLTPIMEPVRELNRAMSQLSMILELSGNPVAVLENVTDSQDIAVQAGRGLGAAGAGASLPAGPAAGRRHQSARRLHQPGVPHPA